MIFAGIRCSNMSKGFLLDPKAASDTVPKLDDAALLAQKERKGQQGVRV